MKRSEFFFSFSSQRASKGGKKRKTEEKKKKLEKNYLTVQQVQRVLRHGASTVQRLRREGPGQGVVEPDVADEPPRGRVEDEARGAGGVVCLEGLSFFYLEVGKKSSFFSAVSVLSLSLSRPALPPPPSLTTKNSPPSSSSHRDPRSAPPPA